MLERFATENLIASRNTVWDITNLGAVLFAKHLDEFPSLGRKAARVIVYDGVDKLKRGWTNLEFEATQSDSKDWSIS